MDVLQRMAEKERVIVWYSADGKAYIGRPDYNIPTKHKLLLYLPKSGRVSENNVNTSRVSRSWRDRYATITVAGTGANDATTWARTSHRKHTITDSTITSARPLILVSGDVRTLDQAKQMATLEQQRRLRDATVYEYTVPGHFGVPAQPGTSPALFEAGDLVDLVDEPAGLTSVKAVILNRRFILDENGPRTMLKVYPQVWMTA